MHNNAATFFPLSVIPPVPKFGSNFRTTDPYLGDQLLKDPPDPDAQQCRKFFFPPLSDPANAEVRNQLQNYESVPSSVSDPDPDPYSIGPLDPDPDP
jgi:hypothetical protein